MYSYMVLRREVFIEPGDIFEIPAQVKHRAASKAFFVMQSASDAPCSLEELVKGTQVWHMLPAK